jgi:hypothetical protein
MATWKTLTGAVDGQRIMVNLDLVMQLRVMQITAVAFLLRGKQWDLHHQCEGTDRSDRPGRGIKLRIDLILVGVLAPSTRGIDTAKVFGLK